MDSTNLLFAFGLTLFAGLSTGIGSALAFFAKRTNAIYGLIAGMVVMAFSLLLLL